MKKKSLILFFLAVCAVEALFAGGILTNTNQSVYFIRMPSRNASLEIDAAYSNPAGLVKLKDGFHFSFTNQSAFQTRTINSTFAPFIGSGGSATKEYEGKASVAIIPSLQAAYKKGKWVLSGNIAIAGGGGQATFNSGLPMFEAGASLLPGIFKQVSAGLNAQGVPATISSTQYSVEQYMSGKSFIYGAQIGGSYAINEMFSAYAGFRLNIVNNHYEGHLKNLQANITSTGLSALGMTDFTGAMTSPEALLNMALANPNLDASSRNSLTLLKKAAGEGAYLDSKQSGWGISPILGFNFNYEKLNVGMKYEFKTSLNVENKTSIDDTGIGNTGMFADGVNTAYDIPALFAVGVSYRILPQLIASVGYNHFFDSDAKTENDRQKNINGGTNEFLFGAEYQINDMFLVSAGGQITRQGVTDAYQTDLSFSLNSYSIGFGGAVNVSDNVKINVGYFWTNYSDWNRTRSENYLNSGYPMTDTFSRTNKVFAAGVDFRF